MFSFFKKKYKPFSNLTLLAWTATEQHATQAKVKNDNDLLFEVLSEALLRSFK